jgi:hypothetical protein
MIGVDELAESARYQDALAEEHEFEDHCKLLGVDQEAIEYVAHQRALRCAMLLDGQDPRALSRTEKTPIDLSPAAQQMMPTLAALSLDGIAIGLDAARKHSADAG